MHRGAGGVIRIKQRLDGALTKEMPGDGCGDLVAGDVGHFGIQQQGRVGIALADQAGIQPFFRDALNLPEEVKLGRFAGVPQRGFQQALRELEDERGGAHVAEVLERHVGGFADDAGVLRL